MNNTTKLALSFVAGLVIATLGFFVFSGRNDNQQNQQNLGAITVPSVSTTTHGTAGQSSLLYQWEFNVVKSLGGLRAGSLAVTTTTAAILFPAVASTSPQSTTTLIGIPAAVGDQVLIQPSTSSPFFFFAGSVETASTTSATLRIMAVNASGSVSGIAPSSTLFYVSVLPRTSFGSPAALYVSTTTTPYSN